jgi:hypothetical protein
MTMKERLGASLSGARSHISIFTPELAHVLVLLLKIGTNFIQYGERERQRTSV